MTTRINFVYPNFAVWEDIAAMDVPPQAAELADRIRVKLVTDHRRMHRRIVRNGFFVNSNERENQLTRI